ncbi:hypothetical protein BACPU_15500 [Bacillus pumilus]|nr:hypothetical protein BACPU_15500 [Bacillus pumilus]
MHKILAIVSLKLKETFKSPTTLLFLFAMPLLISFIFGSTASDTKKPTVAFIYQSNQGEVNQEIFRMLKENTRFQWIKTTEQEAKELVANEKAVVSIKVTNDLKAHLKERKAIFDVMVYKKTEEYAALSSYLVETAAIIYEMNRGVNQQKNVYLSNVLKEFNASNPISMTEGSLVSHSPNLIPIGFTIMFMMFAISSSASSIHLEYKTYTWQRLLSSPVHKIQVLSGYLLAYFLLGWIQLGVLLAVLFVFFNMYLGNLIQILLFGSVVVGLVVSLGFMMATLSKTKKQAEISSTILIVSTCMLGGIYWPLDIVPDIMNSISKAVPQTWMMEGFGEIMSGTANESVLFLDSMILIVFTIIFMIVGWKSIRSY